MMPGPVTKAFHANVSRQSLTQAVCLIANSLPVSVPEPGPTLPAGIEWQHRRGIGSAESAPTPRVRVRLQERIEPATTVSLLVDRR